MPDRWTHTALAQQVVFGSGSLAQLPDLVRTIGARRALLVTTAGRLASPEGDRVVAALGRSLASTFSEVASHVPVPLVQQAVLQARRDAIDLVVSFGGGSCADLGKAVCFFLEQEAGMPGSSHVDRPLVPHLSIPTTYSGAELTPFFGMTDPSTRQKQGAGGPTSAPIIAVYDPDLTLSTPARVSAETGMNALAHCVEAAWSPTRAMGRPAPRCSPGPASPAGACSTRAWGCTTGWPSW
jgi:alcohol dehydrogenase class IV